MVEIEMLASCRRPPRTEPVHVIGIGSVSPAVVHEPGPQRRSVVSPRLGLEIRVANSDILASFSQIGQLQPGLFFPVLVGAYRERTVRQKGQMQDEVWGRFGLLQRRIDLPVHLLDRKMVGSDHFIVLARAQDRKSTRLNSS